MKDSSLKPLFAQILISFREFRGWLRKVITKSWAAATVNNKATPVWRRLIAGSELAEQHIHLRVGQGESVAVEEQWLSCGRLASRPSLAGIRIRQFWKGNRWNYNRFSRFFWHPSGRGAAGGRYLSGLSAGRSSVEPQSGGEFTSASAWQVAREHFPVSPFWAALWHADIPLKWSILVSRCALNKLPTDDKVQETGFSLASRSLL